MPIYNGPLPIVLAKFGPSRYAIECIVKSKMVGSKNKSTMQYLVRWAGDWAPQEKETWEPQSSLFPTSDWLACSVCGRSRIVTPAAVSEHQDLGTFRCTDANRGCGEPDVSSVRAGGRRGRFA